MQTGHEIVQTTVSKIETALTKLGVTELDLQKARQYQQKVGGLLERLLINMGSLSEDDLPQFYSMTLGLDIFEARKSTLKKEDIRVNNTINIQYCLKHGWLPLRYDTAEHWCEFITKDPLNHGVQQYIQFLDLDVDIKICDNDTFDKLLHDLYDGHNEANVDSGVVLSDSEEDRIRELASEAPTVNLLNSFISRALKRGASDMHLEPVEGRLRVRFRIDGVLHDIETVPKRLELAIVSRLKILSGMDIAEKRRPQDGKIEMKISNIPLDIRVSALPLQLGESVVMRFLRKDSVTYDFSVLGLSNDLEVAIKEDLQSTSGVVLLTGPTGSGKTTTLYTFLNELNSDDVKIITLEDPVEYQLPGLNQVQIRPEIDFDFSAGLRSVVRQDPDVIMLGEIRDSETCRIAMQAALTGHLVLSTVHTNDAPSAFTRLLDLGVQEFLLNAALVSIIAQRLARRLCKQCSEDHAEASKVIEKYELHKIAQAFNQTDIRIKQAKGCESCNGSGYSGRFALIEYLRCDDAIKALAKDENFITHAKAHNKQSGFRTLLEDGLLRVIKGETTIDEVIRVCG